MQRFRQPRVRRNPKLPSTPASLSRRDFLKLAGVSAAAAGLYPLLRDPDTAAAQPSSTVKTLIEDIRLDSEALGAGSLNGVLATPRGIAIAPGLNRGEYASTVLVAQTPFTHIGLHWVAEAGEQLGFEVRSSVDGQGWSPWEAVAIEAHAAGSGAEETFGALVSAERASRLQFRAVLEDHGRPPVLLSTTATLINSSDGPSTLSLDATADQPPLTSGGAVLTRGQWGADETLRFSSGTEIWPRMYVPAKKAVVHHTATSNAYSDLEGAKAEVRAIYAYHAVTLGWGDIGYHVLIDKFGNVHEGRHSRGAGATRETFGPGVVAGHAFGHNYGSTGIALLGTFTKAGEGGKAGASLTATARASLVDVLAWECDRNDIDPQDASDFLLSDDSWNDGLANVCGHRDCVATICPGGNIYDQVPSLRSDVATRLAQQRTLDASLDSSAGDTVPLGSVGGATFNWSGSGSSFQFVLEGWRRLAGSEDIVYLAGFDADRYSEWRPTTLEAATFAALFDEFGLGNLEAGHYTLHVLATGDGTLSYQADHTLLVIGGGGNSAPSAMITSPSDGSTFPSGTAIAFAGSASDAEDGDLTPALTWTSNVDGLIGSGGSFSATLSEGTHTITAEVTDTGGLTATASIVVTIELASTGITLSATGYKVRGVQHADLAWTGATSSVKVFRNNALIASVNGAGYVDNIGRRGGGSYLYRVEGGTLVSNVVTVSF